VQIKETYATATNAWYEVVLHEGRNQQIRRMFEAIGHSVVKLRRSAIGFLRDEKLRPGHFRMLTAEEVARLTRVPRKAPAKKPRAGGVHVTRTR
jgi:23S rRNA pseudouridine2605 synthase